MVCRCVGGGRGVLKLTSQPSAPLVIHQPIHLAESENKKSHKVWSSWNYISFDSELIVWLPRLEHPTPRIALFVGDKISAASHIAYRLDANTMRPSSPMYNAVKIIMIIIIHVRWGHLCGDNHHHFCMMRWSSWWRLSSFVYDAIIIMMTIIIICVWCNDYLDNNHHHPSTRKSASFVYDHHHHNFSVIGFICHFFGFITI